MKYQGKSMMSLNEMARLAIDYEGDGYVTGYPIVSGDDTYILNGVIEANEEYITINQWVPVFSESLKPVSPTINENQQIVLEWSKEQHKEGIDIFYAIHYLMSGDVMENELNPVYVALSQLNVHEQTQVLEVFLNWAIEQEEE